MNQYIFRGVNVNPKLLTEELAATIQGLFEGEGRERRALYSLSFTRGLLTISSENRLDSEILETILKAHNPNGKSSGEVAEEKRRNLEAGVVQKLRVLGFSNDELEVMLHVLMRLEARAVGQ